jgi:hypothetical protein
MSILFRHCPSRSPLAGFHRREIIWMGDLIASPFGGTVFPVNLKRPSVLGIN